MTETEAKTLWKQAIELMPLRAYVKDMDAGGRYVLMNALGRKDFGAADPIGRLPSEVLPREIADHYDHYERKTRETSKTGGPTRTYEETVAPSGARIDIRTVEVPFRAESGRRYVAGFCTDLTEEIEMRKRLEEQLELTARAEAQKSYFFASVSHDIRTPLNSIIGFSELLKGDIDPKTRDQYVEAIASSGEVLMSLVNDILDLAKLEAGKLDLDPRPTDMARMVRELAVAFLPQAQAKGLDLTVDLQPDIPCVDIDPQRVRQILNNLVGNAIKYTDRGWVKIAAEFKPDPSEAGFGRLRFGVVDSGRGISPEDQSRLMQPFVQLKRTDQGKGTGLGLAICNRLAKKMGGEIAIESRVGVGSAFRVSLPRVAWRKTVVTPPAPTLTQRIRLVTREPDFAGVKLLLVDDMSMNILVLQKMLARMGVTNVLTATSGSEAIEILGTTHGITAVLTDMWMPGIGGADLVAAIRADTEYRNLPVYAVTADVDTSAKSAALGFNGVLLKPVTLKSVGEFLEAHTRGEW